MIKTLQGIEKKIFSFDMSGMITHTEVSGFKSLHFVGEFTDEISNSEIVKKLESLQDETATKYLNSSEARRHIKNLMSR